MTKEQMAVFEASLDKSIAFHSKNQNDPHNVGNAVMVALLEVKAALNDAKATSSVTKDSAKIRDLERQIERLESELVEEAE